MSSNLDQSEKSTKSRTEPRKETSDIDVLDDSGDGKGK